MKVNIKSLTEQHASWLASNPVVGCPMNCAYCFLRQSGLTNIKPKILFSPEKALDNLISSKFYIQDIPVATGTRTDYFATPENISYLRDYLYLYNKKQISNPLIIITKKKIPDSIIHLLVKLQKKGSTFIIFLSYSGLNNDIEKGINHKDIKKNFIRLKRAKLNVIHYWRPLIPQNSTKKIMSSVIKYVMRYAKASVVTGLRLTPDMKKDFWFWRNIQNLDINLSKVEGVWPLQAKIYLKKFMKQYPQYPITYASSCAIAYTLGIPDYNAFYNTSICTSNSCPSSQRNICKKFYDKHIITDQMVQQILNKLEIKNMPYKLIKGKKLMLSKPLEHSKIVNIVQTLKISVQAKEEKKDDYGWGSSVSKRKPYYMQ